MIPAAKQRAWRPWLGLALVAGPMLVTLAVSWGPRAGRFLYYLEASTHAQGSSSPLSLWERVVYSFILSV